jgi:hypothetical protein
LVALSAPNQSPGRRGAEHRLPWPMYYCRTLLPGPDESSRALTQMSDLNKIFRRMDDVVATHPHVYKVETVGAEYLCVAGVRTRCSHFLPAHGPCLAPAAAPRLMCRLGPTSSQSCAHSRRVGRESRASHYFRCQHLVPCSDDGPRDIPLTPPHCSPVATPTSQVPDACESPTCAAISFALDVVQEAQELFWASGVKVELKVGIHNGPLTAGIMGKKPVFSWVSHHTRRALSLSLSLPLSLPPSLPPSHFLTHFLTLSLSLCVRAREFGAWAMDK